jgi:hypothetical protein
MIAPVSRMLRPGLATLLLAMCASCGGKSAVPIPDAAMDSAADAAYDGGPIDSLVADRGDALAPDRAPPDMAPDTTGDLGPPAQAAGYDVQAVLTVTPQGPTSLWDGFPRNHTFTLFFDPVARTVSAGAAGSAGSAPVTSSDGRTFRTGATLSVGVDFSGPICPGSAQVSYDEIVFTIEGDSLRGTGRGRASFIMGDVGTSATVTAVLTGAPDATPPRLKPAGTPMLDPMSGFTLAASEPLLPTSRVRLTGGGVDVALDPVVGAGGGWDGGAGASSVVRGFSKPKVALLYNQSYRISVEDLIDLGGRHGQAADAVTFTTEAAPPLVPEDGFESAASPLIGGAGVITSSSGLTPIAGTKSALVFSSFGGTNQGLNAGPRLTVRLALSPGDTRVRATVRTVTPYAGLSMFYGTLQIATPGKTVKPGTVPPAGPLTEIPLPQGSRVWVGPSRQLEVPLPPDAAGEIVFDLIVAYAGYFSCGLPPPPGGLLIDDLRVE